MNDWLSPQAQKAVENGQARQHARNSRMEQGPHLNGDILTIPSELYHEEAATFWRSMGFAFDREFRIWERDTQLPLNGKVYSAQSWLKSARRKYAEFWPGWAGEAK